MCELQNYLISESFIYQLKDPFDYKTVKPLISDTYLHALMPNNVRKMADWYKPFCGCKICFIICYIQASLNRYRLWIIPFSHLMKRNKKSVGVKMRMIKMKIRVTSNFKILNNNLPFEEDTDENINGRKMSCLPNR